MFRLIVPRAGTADPVVVPGAGSGGDSRPILKGAPRVVDLGRCRYTGLLGSDFRQPSNRSIRWVRSVGSPSSHGFAGSLDGLMC